MKENQSENAFFEMVTAKDMYKKLEYEYDRINQNSKYVIYDYMNFIFTAYHLIEWIENDEDIDKRMHFSNHKYYIWLRTLCNRSKHYVLENTNGEKTEDNNKLKIKRKEFDFSYVNFNNFSFEPIHYYIDIDGQELNLHTFVREIFEEYKKFFD